MTKNYTWLYALLVAGCVAGYAWLGFVAHDPGSDTTVCLLKNVTGIPCPSCGSTRALVALSSGDLSGIFRYNPIGMIIAAILLVAPFWIAFDLLTGRRTLASGFIAFEHFVQRKWVAIPAVVLLVANWIWTYSKGL